MKIRCYKLLKSFLSVLLFFAIYVNITQAQLKWTKYEGNPILTEGPSGSWNDHILGPPSVLFDGTTYHMWHSGNSGIGYATSDDGIHWNEYPGNPVFSVSGGTILGNSVLFDGNSFHLWYCLTVNYPESEIGYATSTNGTDWTPYAGNPVLSATESWEGSGVTWPSVVRIDSTYHLWYNGSTHKCVGYAISEDGINWIKHPGNPVIKRTQLINLGQSIYQHDIIKMWFWRSPGGGKIYLAISPDGINWTSFDEDPAIEPGDPGEWDLWLAPCAVVSRDTTFDLWYTAMNNSVAWGIGYATSTPPMHDNAIFSVFDSLNAVPLYCDFEFTPRAQSMKFGISAEYDIPVNCRIHLDENILYDDTQTIASLPYGTFHCEDVVFSPWHCKSYTECTYNITYESDLPNDEDTTNDSITTTLTASPIIDNFSSGLYKWIPDSCWILYGSSATGCLRNTAKSSYDKNVDSWVEFKYSFDLSQLSEAHISYRTLYYIEDGKDFGYVEVSSDGGSNWTQLGAPYTGVQALWTDEYRSLTDFCKPECHSVKLRFHFVSDSVTTQPAMGWYIDDIEIYPTSSPTAVATAQNLLPQHFALSHNYPNPFNGSTTIAYSLPEAAEVKISIYNLLGQEVITLLHKEQQPGTYTVHWDCTDMFGRAVPSGVYIGKMTTEQFSAAKKMLYVK